MKFLCNGRIFSLGFCGISASAQVAKYNLGRNEIWENIRQTDVIVYTF